MIWAGGDEPARLVWPEDAFLRFGFNLAIILAGILIISAVTLTIYSRYRNGHWPWTYCPVCAGNRRTEKARKELAKRRMRS